MTVNSHPQSAAVLCGLQQLAEQTASTEWRGLLVLRASAQVVFKWPPAALVLAQSLAEYRTYLGTTQSLLVLDMRDTLHADALAATIPTVHAQGLAILVLPLDESPFSERLVNQLPARFSQCVTLTPCTNDNALLLDLSAFHFCLQRSAQPSRFSIESLTREQRVAYERLYQHVEQHRQAPALINAPRGRGKSTLLGVLAQQLSDQGQRVWLCAPSRRQAATLLGAAGAGSQIKFIAPDALLADDCEPVQGHLIVDEAASLPRHMLDTLIARYPSVIMATTSEGYETCGRGFLLQFQAQLHSMFSHFLSLQLTQPIRFAANCPLERWLNDALLLTPLGFANKRDVARYTLSAAKQRHYSHQPARALDDDTLAACFDLLMDAHYQTSPNDLKLLLNDPSQSLCLQWEQGDEAARPVLVGVVWLSEEGGLDNCLANEVMSGTRRPPGNLLAQSLARHVQSPRPATAIWLRVVRIAVRHDRQQQGLGSELLDHVVSSVAADPRYAGIGTSFASAAQINRFWCRHGFKPVKIGSRKDSTTARHALLMLRTQHDEWAEPLASWTSHFYQELPACQQLYQLSHDYIASLHSEDHKPSAIPSSCDNLQQGQLSYAAWAQRKIQAFASGALDLDSVRATLLTYVPQKVASNPLLQVAVYTSGLSIADKRRLNLAGRKDLINQVRQVCLTIQAQL